MAFSCECGSDAVVAGTRNGRGYMRRRYKCKKCDRRWTTIEIVIADGKPGQGICSEFMEWLKDALPDSMKP